MRVLLVFVFVCLTLTGNAIAQKSGNRVFGSESGPIAAEAQIDQVARRHNVAIKKLNKALKIKGLTSYEVSTLQRMVGASYYSLGNNKKAIRAFEKSIKAGGLLDSERVTFQANIAQLNILEKNYELGAKQLETYFLEGGTQKPNLVKLITQAYVMSENYGAAIPWAELMLEKDIVRTRKEYDTLLFLFDSPEKRPDQMLIANKMLQLWKDDKSLLLKVGLLRGKANKEGVDPVLVAGQSHLLAQSKPNMPLKGSNQEAKPIIRVPAIVPSNAEKSGHCNFLFDVNKEGQVFNVRTISCSDVVFEKPALKAIKAWRYSPKIINGEAVESKGIENKMSFRLHNSKGELIPE